MCGRGLRGGECASGGCTEMRLRARRPRRGGKKSVGGARKKRGGRADGWSAGWGTGGAAARAAAAGDGERGPPPTATSPLRPSRRRPQGRPPPVVATPHRAQSPRRPVPLAAVVPLPPPSPLSTAGAAAATATAAANGGRTVGCRRPLPAARPPACHLPQVASCRSPVHRSPGRSVAVSSCPRVPGRPVQGGLGHHNRPATADAAGSSPPAAEGARAPLSMRARRDAHGATRRAAAAAAVQPSRREQPRAAPATPPARRRAGRGPPGRA